MILYFPFLNSAKEAVVMLIYFCMVKFEQLGCNNITIGIMCSYFVCLTFKQRNPDGQKMLVSTLTLSPRSMTHAPLEEDMNMSFGRFFFISSGLMIKLDVK